MKQLTASGVHGFKNHLFSDNRGTTTKADFSLDFKFDSRQLLSVSNYQSGTLRGLHFQREPSAETKIVTCVSGIIYDVVVNLESLLREDPEVFSIYLGDGCDFQGLLVPSNFAHGYLTLSDQVSITYLMDEVFDPNLASGLRWDDPKLNIQWPSVPKIISNRDSDWALL
jgi:dTDP-4-dehydrorhamnose 3,5-epimerase